MNYQQKLKNILLQQRKPAEYQKLKRVIGNIKKNPTENVIKNMRLSCALHDSHSFCMRNHLEILDRWLNTHNLRVNYES